MSMVKARAYFEKIAKDLGYKIDPGVFSSTLSSQSQRSCHVVIGKAEPEKSDMNSVDFSAPITVQLFVGKVIGGTNLEEKTTLAAEEFIASAFQKRAEAQFKKIGMGGYDVKPFDESNERIPIAEIEFEIGFVLGF
jgi:hypothetical protein